MPTQIMSFLVSSYQNKDLLFYWLERSGTIDVSKFPVLNRNAPCGQKVAAHLTNPDL